ncbi:hypothetical protein LNO89_30610 [Klebsiella pneumoniae subsp. pneumoniae]|nr:hypothetical protein [Klebsiella pneumoniae subsp. pneumoniae]
MLGIIFNTIAITALIGCIASLIGSFIANVDRKRKHIAVLRLLGFTRPAVGVYVISQGALLSLDGLYRRFWHLFFSQPDI